MHVREFPVLGEEDRAFVSRLAAGMGEDAARTHAYLLLRRSRERFADDPAPTSAVRVGTDLSTNAVRGALERLEERGLVEQTAVRNRERGRPPKAWFAVDEPEAAVEQVRRQHAGALVERARDLHVASDAGRGETDGRERGTTDDDGEPRGGGRDRLTLALNWAPNGLQLPFYAARAADAYDERGLAVSFEHCEGSNRAVSAVRSGAATAALAGAGTVVRARAEGASVVPVAVPYQRAMTVLFAVRDRFGEPFERVRQLRGRRVGTPGGAETGLLGRMFLSQAGVLDDVDLVTVDGEEARALLDGEVDAVTGTFSDPDRLTDRGYEVDAVRVAERFPIYGPALVVDEATLDRREDLVERFLAGTVAGWTLATRRPTEATAELRDSVDDPVGERRKFERAAAEFGESDAVRTNGWGYQRPEPWERLETALGHLGLLADRADR